MNTPNQLPPLPPGFTAAEAPQAPAALPEVAQSPAVPAQMPEEQMSVNSLSAYAANKAAGNPGYSGSFNAPTRLLEGYQPTRPAANPGDGQPATQTEQFAGHGIQTTYLGTQQRAVQAGKSQQHL